MENVLKKQQSDQRIENSRRPQIGLQHSEKSPHPEAGFKQNEICKMNNSVFRRGTKGLNVCLMKIVIKICCFGNCCLDIFLNLSLNVSIITNTYLKYLNNKSVEH